MAYFFFSDSTRTQTSASNGGPPDYKKLYRELLLVKGTNYESLYKALLKKHEDMVARTGPNYEKMYNELMARKGPDYEALYTSTLEKYESLLKVALNALYRQVRTLIRQSSHSYMSYYIYIDGTLVITQNISEALTRKLVG